MTCAELDRWIDDYVDGDLSEATFQEVELHLSGCAACRDRERGLRGLLADARALRRSVSPPRDLWPGVAERIAGSPPGTAQERRPPIPSRAGLAAAAAALVALSVLLVDRRDPAPGAADQARPQAAARSVSSGDAIEAEYVRATEALLAAIEERRPQLAPETLRSIEENLLSIERALADIHAALRQDPRNPQLAQILKTTHQRRLDFLRRLVRLTRA